MRKYNSLKMGWLLTGFGLLPIVLLVLSQGCSGMKGSGGDLSSQTAMCGGGTAENEIVILPNTRTVSLVYGQVTLDNMLSCTGLGNASPQTEAEWAARQGVFSDDGYASTVTSPMMMAIAALAARVCQDIIDKELPQAAVDRFIFSDYDLSANAGAPSGPQLDGVIDRLAVGCWQRNPAMEERNMIHSYAGQIGQAGANAGRSEALAVCTAMLSSLSAIEL